MKITIEVIPHDQQRYPTVGDWQWDETQENLTIKVSKLSNWKRESCVILHELAEVFMCKFDNVSEADVDAYDIQYEEDRSKGLHGPLDDPGDDPKAPYYRQHFLATNIERTLADALDLDWADYGREVAEL